MKRIVHTTFWHVTLNRRIFRLGLISPLIYKSNSVTDLKEKTKICGKSICRPLEQISKDCLANEIFPSDWKKGNIVPVHKKVINSA